jgi:hypothetical protein
MNGDIISLFFAFVSKLLNRVDESTGSQFPALLSIAISLIFLAKSHLNFLSNGDNARYQT